MATTTYEPIATVTAANSSTTTLTFGSGGTLSQSYTDFVIVGQFGWQTSDDYLRITFNGDTTQTNYSMTNVRGDGSSAASGRYSGSLGRYDVTAHPGTNGSLNTIVQINVMNYSNSSTNKSWLVRHNAASIGTLAAVGMWQNTAAITSITLSEADGGNFLSGSTFTLYGIANAQIEAPKATGGVITYDDTYFYHTFGASGTFTPTQSLTADILVVAGGGSGGLYGGGGAGGLRTFTSQSLTTTGYTCTVGAGGSSASGVNSSFAGSGFTTINATGGGRGGLSAANGSSGGSGGGGGAAGGSGGSSYSGGAGNAGSYSPVEGFAGGNNWNQSGAAPGGGGGGAGAVGGNASSGVAGNGGIGATSSLITSIVTSAGVGQLVSSTGYLAGGGGGGVESSSGTAAGAGGAGGGGAGGLGAAGQNGLPNSGGGGGSYGGSGANGNGGSGVVVVRYAK